MNVQGNEMSPFHRKPPTLVLADTASIPLGRPGFLYLHTGSHVRTGQSTLCLSCMVNENANQPSLRLNPVYFALMYGSLTRSFRIAFVCKIAFSAAVTVSSK